MTIAERVLRDRTREEENGVRRVELFFDLVYVFAVTQISHFLLGALTPLGALQSLVLWFAIWLGWQYACWFTNWFDPDAVPVRLTLFATMFLALVMGVVLPEAFGEYGLLFAACYAAMQVGRSVMAVAMLGGGHALSPNYRRILAWLSVSAVFWIAGGFAAPGWRLPIWVVAVACEYVSPMAGFRFPGLGRSRSSDWTIAGEHLAERCHLFVILALGESILVTGRASPMRA